MYSSGTGFSNRHHRNGSSFISLMFNFRTFTIFVCVILIIILFYYYNESQDLIAKFENEKDKCQQKLDSVSAQLQVVYEHKSRLEKSLQQENDNSARLKQDNDAAVKFAKENAKNEKLKLENKYNELQQREQDIQTKFKDLQLNHSKLTLELERLEAEKQSQEQKAEESLKTAKNRVAEIEDQYSGLAKEVEKLRKENSQLKQTLSDQQNRLPDNSQQSVNNSVKVVERNVPDTFTQSAEGSLKNSVFKWDDRLNRSSVADNIVITAEQIPPFHQVPGNNRENFSRTELNNGSQSDSFASVNNSPLVPQTRAPLPEVKQIHKPFADSHQQQLLENAKFPPMPRDDGQPDAPVLQHPLGEDQQNLLGKPVKFDSKLPDTENLKNAGDSDYAGENIGHLPVNVRDENVDDDFNAQMPDDGKRAAKQQHVDNVLPLPSNVNDRAFNKNIRDVNKAVEDNRLFGNKNAIEAGARVVKEPKEYHAGALGGGGERDENDDYRDDEEEKKYKDPEP